MSLQRMPLTKSSKLHGAIVCNPNRLDDLFQRAVVSKRVQRMLQSPCIVKYILALEAKVIQYDNTQLVTEGKIFVRLPQSQEELDQLRKLEYTEIWELSDLERDRIVKIEGEKALIKGGTEDEKAQFTKLWKASGEDLPLLSRLVGITRESLLGLMHKKRVSGSVYPFPLFRADFFSIFGGTTKEVLTIILEKLRKRYAAKRDLSVVPSDILVTPNLDHIRMLFEENDADFQKIYRRSFLQAADGYYPLVMYGKASVGHQPLEQVTGVDLFMQLINTVGSQALPYTIYLVGGFGNVPYKARDYFVSIYPNLRENFIGISAPPLGFLENKEIMDAIANDIEEKKPDLIFACMTMPIQEKFINELMNRGVNFGIGFCFGRALELVVGYQKKEPALVDRLHLAWIYRMFFDARGDIRKRQRSRVLKDFKFVIKTLFTK
ncbi:WecB/TagA/CpsF family glycosyltransferase [bacterium]|nr:WecB/TagA/CpsF family glycosyltransferase [bacterium]